MVSPKSSYENGLPGPNIRRHQQRRSAYALSFVQKVLAVASVAAIGLLYVVYGALHSERTLATFATDRAVLSGLSLDSWLEAEEVISYEQIYQNIGGGARARDAAIGAVIASPSTDEPDYYYQWVRDAAIIYKTITGQYLAGQFSANLVIVTSSSTDRKCHPRTSDRSLGKIARRYPENQESIGYCKFLFYTSLDLHCSGYLYDQYESGGIGEPKFHVDNSVFDHSWGRPQDDGPAIRATVLMAYANEYLTSGGEAKAIEYLYKNSLPADSVIKADLEYVSHNWQQDSVDLWEEVRGLHFFTMIVQLRAMLEGTRFAMRMSDPEAAEWYQKQAAAMHTKLDDFWSQGQGWIVSTLGRDPSSPRGGLDCGTILGSLHGMSDLQRAYSPESDKMLATHYNYVQSMKATYKINNGSNIPGVAVGRYPEDVYDGYHKSLGNPWYLCTSAAAQQMYAAAHSLRRAKNITVTEISEQFYQQFLPSASADSMFLASDRDYDTILSGMRALGDSFLATVRHFAATNGSLSEQYNRDTGIPQGARDLTWSYGAFISAVQQRRNELVI